MDTSRSPITDHGLQQQNLPVPVPPPPFAQGYGGAQQVVVSQIPVASPVAQQPTTPVQAVGQAVQSGVVTQVQRTQPLAPAGMHKEQMTVPVVPERAPLVELAEGEKIPAEVEGWMEKLEQAGEIKIPEAIKQDKQVILENAKPTTVQDTVVLPLSQSGAAVAAKKTVGDSAKWLYVWCTRLFKMLGDRARWGKEEVGQV